MNLKDMEYFYCLCRYKNFTKAAEKMYVSQPSITMAVNDMKSIITRELKDKIFFNVFIMKKTNRNYSVKEQEVYNKIISYRY